MRGEEDHFALSAENLQELPPHARRREKLVPEFVLQIGITSACAEKSLALPGNGFRKWNYLRMRGEERATARLS